MGHKNILKMLIEILFMHFRKFIANPYSLSTTSGFEGYFLLLLNLSAYYPEFNLHSYLFFLIFILFIFYLLFHMRAI